MGRRTFDEIFQSSFVYFWDEKISCRPGPQLNVVSMKQIVILFSCLIFSFIATYAQKTATSPDPLELKELKYDFGKIRQGRPVTHDFQVVNRGTSPLIIERVEATCGCTTPEWSREPVAPGETSVIRVGFNAGSEGHFSKTITVIYNEGKTRGIVISGEVYPAPATSAPLNPSISLIKQSNQ